jgi:hypothetical protein
VKCKNRSDTKTSGNWNHTKIIQKIPQQHTRRARKHKIKEVQKTTTMGIAHIQQKLI